MCIILKYIFAIIYAMACPGIRKGGGGGTKTWKENDISY